MSLRLVRELAAAESERDGLPVAVACRVLKISRSVHYDTLRRAPSARQLADLELTDTLSAIHTASRGTYGVRRVHAELRLGLGLRCGHKRVWRLMRAAGICGIHRRRFRRPGQSSPAAAVHDDLVHRRFVADGPDRLWVTDITQHPTTEGWVYTAVVLDVWSRRVIGWAIADHLKTDSQNRLVVDALDMAPWRRRPPAGQTVVHSDRGTQYTSWLFGHRLRQAGLLGSMGAVASAYDNALVESFFGPLQIELLDRRRWTTRAELAAAIFEWIEAFHNPSRRHSALGYLTPNEFETLPTIDESAA